MKKIAFVNQRYGLEVNGGSEYYTRVMAEKLSTIYQVEVLTTKALDYVNWENHYESEVDFINGIKVRRFHVERKRNRNELRLTSFMKKYKIGNLNKVEERWIKAQGPYSPQLISFIKEHTAEYDAFIFVTYLYYPTVFGMPVVKEKSIFIPTAHDESYIYFELYRKLFTMPAAFVYLTDEEKEFVEELFHNQCIPNDVIGVGVDLPEQISEQAFRSKFNIRDEYLIYVGRIDKNKGCMEMFQAFEAYKHQYPNLKLVLMGKEYLTIPNSKEIISLGFVSEQDKYNGIAGAKALWLPSEFESLSISVLEAMGLGKPVIVNGKSNVLKGHCDKSHAGVYYMEQKEVAKCLNRIFSEEYQAMCEKAINYVEKNYSWNKILERFTNIIEMI